MFYELLYPLRHSASWLGWLNVIRYVPFRIICSTMTSMAICFVFSPWFIRALQKQQIGQVIRDEGMIPEAHIK
jgi:phospho-N-acetylmuramoyl-pentapeptide-transferase